MITLTDDDYMILSRQTGVRIEAFRTLTLTAKVGSTLDQPVNRMITRLDPAVGVQAVELGSGLRRVELEPDCQRVS
jgi:hypothetical protein